MNGSAFSFENIDNITGINIITMANSSNAHLVGLIRQSSGEFSNIAFKNNLGNSILTIEHEESFVQGRRFCIRLLAFTNLSRDTPTRANNDLATCAKRDASLLVLIMWSVQGDNNNYSYV